MTDKCTVTLSNEQYVLLMDCLKLAKVQQRMKLGDIYRGGIPYPGGEKGLRKMEGKIDDMVKLQDYLLEKVEWIEEGKKISEPSSLHILSFDHLNDDKILVDHATYEKIKANPNELCVEAMGEPLIILKTVGVGK